MDEAVGWASELDYVDEDRIHLIGWSMGGWGILNWLSRDRPESDSVQSAVVVYPGCMSQGVITNAMPVLMLLGGADDITPASTCEDLVTRSVDGPTVMVHTYPGARHGFDNEGAPPVLAAPNGMTIGYQREAAEAAWREILAFLRTGE